MPVEKTFEKVDDQTLKVNKLTIYNQPISQTYDYAFLLAQREQITASRDRELAEINELISQAEALGLTLQVEEE